MTDGWEMTAEGFSIGVKVHENFVFQFLKNTFFFNLLYSIAFFSGTVSAWLIFSEEKQIQPTFQRDRLC